MELKETVEKINRYYIWLGTSAQTQTNVKQYFLENHSKFSLKKPKPEIESSILKSPSPEPIQKPSFPIKKFVKYLEVHIDYTQKKFQ